MLLHRIAPPLLLALAALLGAADADNADPAPDPAQAAGRALATEVAEAFGLDAWPNDGVLEFTWTLRDRYYRGYRWDLASGEVAVNLGSKTVTVPADGGEADALDEEQRDAHQSFINDSYWLLFPLHLAWDHDLTLRDLGRGPVPGFDALGELRRLQIDYPDSGGYTPGDRYVLYLGDDSLPRAWAYHPGGAAEPRVVSTREARQAVAGLHCPTRFRTADGEAFIVFEDLRYRPVTEAQNAQDEKDASEPATERAAESTATPAAE